MAVKNYGIFDKWLNSEQQNVVDVKSTDGVINSVKVNGQEYGGGGSSDFSTAEVTVSDTSGRSPVLMFSRTLSMNMGGTDFRITTATAQGSGTYTAILYYGQAGLEINNASDLNIAVSGNIEEMQAGSYIITGDCTITIS